MNAVSFMCCLYIDYCSWDLGDKSPRKRKKDIAAENPIGIGRRPSGDGEASCTSAKITGQIVGRAFSLLPPFRRLSEEMHIVYSFPGHNTSKYVVVAASQACTDPETDSGPTLFAAVQQRARG
jgi:hypothetical protein